MQIAKTSLIYKLGPFNSASEGPCPTLILLHGRGANEDDLLGLVPYLDPRFFVIAARAPLPFSFGGYTWFDMTNVGSPDQKQFEESYERLAEFVSDMKKHYPIDPERLFFLGFSMGAVMSYAIALTKPEETRAVVAHSGYVPGDSNLRFQWNELGRTGFFVAHGVYDPVICVDFGRRAKDLLIESKADLTYHEYPIAHQISEQSLTDLATWLKKYLDVPKAR